MTANRISRLYLSPAVGALWSYWTAKPDDQPTDWSQEKAKKHPELWPTSPRTDQASDNWANNRPNNQLKPSTRVHVILSTFSAPSFGRRTCCPSAAPLKDLERCSKPRLPRAMSADANSSVRCRGGVRRFGLELYGNTPDSIPSNATPVSSRRVDRPPRAVWCRSVAEAPICPSRSSTTNVATGEAGCGPWPHHVVRRAMK